MGAITYMSGSRAKSTAAVAAVAIWCLTSGCAPSLASVKTTAGIGSRLTEFETAFDVGPIYCRASSAVGQPPDPNCANLQSDLANWHAVNHALVGYAAALAAMADDSKDKSEKDDITTALGSVAKLSPSWSGALSATTTGGVSLGVSSLISGIVGVYRRERLAKTIRASNDALAAVVKGIDENIALLDRADQNILTTIDGTLSSIAVSSSPAPDKQGLALTLTAFAAEVTRHRTQLASYKTAADAFAKAHDELAKHLKGLGERKADEELLKLIATDVVNIAKGVDTALTAPSPTTH